MSKIAIKLKALYKFPYNDEINNTLKLNTNKQPQEIGFNNEDAGLTSWRLVHQFSMIFKNIFHGRSFCLSLWSYETSTCQKGENDDVYPVKSLCHRHMKDSEHFENNAVVSNRPYKNNGLQPTNGALNLVLSPIRFQYSLAHRVKMY